MATDDTESTEDLERPAGSRAEQSVLMLAVVVEGGLFALAVLLGWVTGIRPFTGFRVTLPAIAIAVAATLPLMWWIVWSMRTPWRPIAKLREEAREALAPLFASLPTWHLAVISILAGVAEEVFFRGVVQVGLGTLTNVWIGLIAASLLFGLAHLVTPSYAVVASLFGVYLGLLLIWTDNLLVAILVHALYDFIALTYILRLWRESPALATDGNESSPTPANG